MTTVDVRDAPGRRRYEAWIGDEIAGFAEYETSGRLVVFTHTEVEQRFSGRGVGSALVRGALDDVRSGGTHRVVALCPFVRRWIASHEDYADLLLTPHASTATD